MCFLLPATSAQAEDLVIACPGGGSYTIVMPSGVAINGKSCAGPIVIDNRVKIIGKEAFSFSKIDSVSIPNSVISIEANGFSYTNLKSISIGNSLERIGFEAFRFSRFESISLPSSLKSIGECALCDTFFSSIVLPSSLVTIGKGAFAREDTRIPLKNIEIPDSVIDIGWYAFSSTGLEILKLGKSIKTIQPGAFQNNKLKRVDIPAAINWISTFAFKGNPLEVLNLSEGLTGIDSEAFANTRITNLVIPSSVTGLGSRAFANIPTLVSVDMSDNLDAGIDIATQLPSIGDVFDQSYNIAQVLYCGTAQGFLVKPTCEGSRKTAADAVSKNAAESAAKEEAEKAARFKEFELEQSKSIADILILAGMSATPISFKVTGKNPVCPNGSARSDVAPSANYYGTTIICTSVVKPEAERLALIAAEKAAGDQKAKQEADAKAAADKVVAEAKAEAAKILAEANAKAKAAAAAAKKTTITCVKGKLTKKVTAVKPVCPKGYKKK